MAGLSLLFTFLLCSWWSMGDAAEGIIATKGSRSQDSINNMHVFFERFFENTRQYYSGTSLPPRLDLVFIMDSSSSVGGSKPFKSLKTFLQSLVNRLSVSPSTTRVGLVRCSVKPSLEFSLDSFMNKECIVKSIKEAKDDISYCARRMKYLIKDLSRYFDKHTQFVGGHHCNLGASLQLTYRLIIQSRRMTSLRYLPKPIVVILCASQRHITSQALLYLKELKELKAEVYILTFAKSILEGKLKLSFPKSSAHYHLAINSPSELENYLAEFVKHKGLGQTCHTNGTTVYDECRRRCNCSNGQMIDCYRVRKEFTSMTLEERRLYIHALKTVSTVKPYKRVYDIITSYHPRWFDDIHQLEYFFPWHRWYILIFENFLRQVDCRVTVPYWDWSRAVSDGRLWRSQYLYDIWYPGSHALGGNGEGTKQCVKYGPFREYAWTLPAFLHQSCLTREFNDCYAVDLPNRTVIDDYLAMAYEDFENFEHNVRNVMHNTFHNAVGGVMSYDESANAPEFWFHHAFLDKTWADWQDRGPRFKHQYFPNVKSKLPGSTRKAAHLIDLSTQPLCIRVKYGPVKDLDLSYNTLDSTVKEAQPISDCFKDNSDDYIYDKH